MDVDGNLQTTSDGIETLQLDNSTKKSDQVLELNEINSRKRLRDRECTFNLLHINDGEKERLKEYLRKGYIDITNYDNGELNCELIRECFELSCYILYDRQILKDVIEKQKSHQTDYVIDFFKYMLRMFFRRYSSEIVLSRTQREDIKELCRKLIKVNVSFEGSLYLVEKASAKEIIEYINTFIS